MRFAGKLERWNDDRGFGFIAPLSGGDPVFVHVSAFPRDGRRPKDGEPLTFEVEPGEKGQKRATRVQRVHTGDATRDACGAPRKKDEALWARRERRAPVSVAGAILMVGMAAYGWHSYHDYGARQYRSAGSVNAQPSATAGQYRCDGRRYCSEMTSCAEAKFFLNNCPDTQMDGDRDGIPCESQWCR